jgi:hypothetical protein
MKNDIECNRAIDYYKKLLFRKKSTILCMDKMNIENAIIFVDHIITSSDDELQEQDDNVEDITTNFEDEMLQLILINMISNICSRILRERIVNIIINDPVLVGNNLSPLSQKNFCKLEEKNIINNEEKNKCPICIEEYKENEITLVLPCKHYFHKDCIKDWLCKFSKKCPVCRDDVENRFIENEDKQ